MDQTCDTDFTPVEEHGCAWTERPPPCVDNDGDGYGEGYCLGPDCDDSDPWTNSGCFPPWVRIAAGGVHTCAVKEDGTAWCWGNNSEGQLGDGTNLDSRTPMRVSGLSGVADIAASRHHSCALKDDGTVWCWGGNHAGQLGDGQTHQTCGTYGDCSPTPVQVPDLSDARWIGAGLDHSCVIKNDDTAWCWGDNTHGQLGDGTSTDSHVPVQVSGLPPVDIAAPIGQHTCALTTDHTLWCWGKNSSGQLGDGTTLDSPTPVQVSGLSDVQAIGGGREHTCAVMWDRTVWCWGDNTFGQLGDGTSTNSATPVHVSGMLDVHLLASGGSYHTCVLKNDGAVWCWGKNEYGQLGDGQTHQTCSSPACESSCDCSPIPVQLPGLSEAIAVAADNGHDGTTEDTRSGHTCAIKNLGPTCVTCYPENSAWCWGSNYYGQLGDGSTTDRFTPIKVLEPEL